MPNRPIVLVHGWSDVSASFQRLGALLQRRLDRPVSLISLADWMSMEDEIRFDDLASAMDRAWSRHALPRDPRAVDAVVHSTGALVIRDWMVTCFEPGAAPVANLVMLAPANFGSPLAHKGRSFIGRVYKGFIAKKPDGGAFQTGTRILKGLELASPYTWQLAERDRFGPGAAHYGPGAVLCTVLVGNRGYGGISAIANEDGSDGTVRLSTANLNCARLHARFPARPDEVGHDVAFEYERSVGRTAFGVVDGFNHGTITLNQKIMNLNVSAKDEPLLQRIVDGLTVDDAGFDAWCDALDAGTRALLPDRPQRGAARHGFQNTVVRVRDQYGQAVEDYLLEFYEKDDDRGRIAEFFHGDAIRSVHAYSDDASYRSVYVDCTRLHDAIDKVGEHLSASLTAMPEIDDRHPVGFETLGDDGIGGMRIPREQIAEVFVPHRTLLVTLELTRQQRDEVFRLGPLRE